MARKRSALAGRAAELTALVGLLAETGPTRHTLAVVAGEPGIGKTTLLDTAADRWRAEDHTVIHIRFAEAASWDGIGAQPTIAALRALFEQLGDPDLADPLDAVTRRCTPDACASARGRADLLAGLTRLFRRLRHTGPAVVIADDVDTLDDPGYALAPACQPGHLVVAACARAGRDRLRPFADRVLDLGGLAEDWVAEQLAKRVGVPADDSLVAALHVTLGPLAGHPGTLLSTVDSLRADGRIATVRGRACLTPGAPIALSAGHHLTELVDRFGTAGRELLALLADGTPCVDDLAELAPQEADRLGRALDALVAGGALTSDESGRLAPICPALSAAYGGGRSEPVDAEALHHRVVTGYQRGDWAAALSAARQLELIGPAAAARRPCALLAAEICVSQGDPRQAAAWLEAAGETAGHDALRGWVVTGMLAAGKDTARALATGWWVYRRARTEPGCERLLTRLALLATDSHQDWRDTFVAELAELHAKAPTPATREALDLVQGIVLADEQRLLASADAARERGCLPDLLTACLALGERSSEPGRWLHEAHELAKRLGAPAAQARAKQLLRRFGVTPPSGRAERPALSETELRVVDLIREGQTNRQISVALLVTEKTVEYYLSRLFAKTGCRSRVDLARRVRRDGPLAASA